MLILEVKRCFDDASSGVPAGRDAARERREILFLLLAARKKKEDLPQERGSCTSPVPAGVPFTELHLRSDKTRRGFARKSTEGLGTAVTESLPMQRKSDDRVWPFQADGTSGASTKTCLARHIHRDSPTHPHGSEGNRVDEKYIPGNR